MAKTRKTRKPRTRSVEYYRCWAGNSGDSGTWDTDFLDIPADTPDEAAALDAAIRDAAAKLKWRNGEPPVFVGFYAWDDTGED